MQDKSNNKEKVMKRLSHLRQIEIELQKKWKENKVFESDAEENWKDKYNLEQKNAKKISNNFSLSLYEWKTSFRSWFFLIKM